MRYVTDQYAVHLLDFFVHPKGANAAMDGIDEQQAAAFAKELSELSKEQPEALQGAAIVLIELAMLACHTLRCPIAVRE